MRSIISMNLHVPKAPGQKRHNAGSAYGACGVGWRAGQQLAWLWLTAKIAPLEGHVEVDFPAERLGMVLTVRLSSGHTERAAHEALGAPSLRRRSDAETPHTGAKIGTARRKMREHRAGTDAWAIWGGSAVAQ